MDGKVAEVIDKYSVAINRGSEHGVQPGMLYALGIDVVDPDTGDTLGYHTALNVVVDRVFPKFCVGVSYRRVPAHRSVVTVNVGYDARRILPGEGDV